MFAFWREADPTARRAFWAASIGWMLDAFDVWIYALVLSSVRADLGLSAATAGGLQSLTLLFSALGGIVFGVLADRWGRVRALTLSVLLYSVFTAACGLAQDVVQLAVFRIGLGIGMGGEWASGAALVAETWRREHRDKAMSFMQSAWALGLGLAAIVNWLVQDVFGLDWRAVFFVGLAPAVFAIWVRSRVPEPEAWQVARTRTDRIPLARALAAPGMRVTLAILAMNMCAMFAVWGFNTWVPSYLKSPGVGLTDAQMSGFVFLMQFGMWLGYVAFGYLSDAWGRRRTYAAYLLLASVFVLAYAWTSTPWVLLVLGPVTGFFATGFFSGFGALTADAYPAEVRATAQGFTYNVGRVAAAAAPFLLGGLTDSHGFPFALSVAAVAYAAAAVTWVFIPERPGRAASPGV